MWLDLGEYRGPSRFHSFVMYVSARALEHGETLLYRSYVTESLRLAQEGKAIRRTYIDLIKPRERIDVDAIIEHVLDVATSE